MTKMTQQNLIAAESDLRRMYPTHWDQWSEVRRTAEIERRVAVLEATRVRDTAMLALDKRRRKIEATYDAAVERAKRAYEEGEG